MSELLKELWLLRFKLTKNAPCKYFRKSFKTCKAKPKIHGLLEHLCICDSNCNFRDTRGYL